MDEEKIHFLKHQFISALKQVSTDTKPKWGKMTLQQMVEHLSEYVRIASGRNAHQTIVTPPENLQKMQVFLMSDKPFRENTPNPLLPIDPVPVKNKSFETALKELEDEIDHFFSVFEKNPHLTTRNPFFGDLNFEMNVQLLYKHALHHLKQFGVHPQSLQGSVEQS
ncbi:MAG: hypothetical protein ICV66_08910 [Chitinophagaceae bacterium]|nr:hypothetical protein [Chitinophagaceae bacterium]